MRMMPRYPSLALAASLAITVLVPARPASADPQPDRPEAPAPMPCRELAPKETVQVDLRETPLGDVARLVSCALGRSLLFSPPTLANQAVSFFGPRPLSRRELKDLWHATLAEAGLIEERHGAFEVIRKAR